MAEQIRLKVFGSVCPVTALSVWHGKILAGCGSQVQIYDVRTGLLEAAFSGLHSTNVHGFRPGPVSSEGAAVLVFGGKCASRFCLPVTASQWSQPVKSQNGCGSSAEEFEDWIWDAVWLQEQSWTVGLALAHNVVLHYDWQAQVILHRVTCKEKYLLYCARFIGNAWSSLVLAAGTVFNQVVLWAVSSRDAEQSTNESSSGVRDDEAHSVLHRLSGHQGVIFSIHYQKSSQRICSVSDDRSIRMWQLQFPNSVGVQQSSGDLDWHCVSFKPMLTLFGHSARVWDVVLLSDKFVSVGEDACCVIWDYSGQVLHRCKGHKGRSIWSIAASDDESFVVTGGGDSSIRQWHLQMQDDTHLTQVHMSVPHHVQISTNDFTRTLALWDYDTLVLMTNKGSLICHTLSAGGWHVVFSDTTFSSYSTLALSTDRRFLAVGSIAGHVRVITRRGGVDVTSIAECTSQVHEGKVCGLTWVDNTHFISTGLGGQCVLAQARSNSVTGGVNISSLAHFELPVCKHRWIVAGCLLPGNTHLVCGDRSGSVHFYHLTNAAETASQLMQTFLKIHGSAGVTSVGFHDNTVFTAGRDGHYRCWGTKDGHLELLNSSRVFKGFDWIDRLIFTDREMFIFGFYSSKFIIWSALRGERLLEAECGGGHRAWDCLHGGAGYRFVFLKAREVVMVTGQQTVGQAILKPPLHGLKVGDMKHISTYRDSEGKPMHVMCTASEDTTVSIGTLHVDKGISQWSGTHNLHGHLSSVRALAVVDSSPPSSCSSRQLSDKTSEVLLTGALASTRVSQICFSRELMSKVLFSAGGRAQIQAWKFFMSLKTHDPSPSQHWPGETVGQKGASAAIPKAVASKSESCNLPPASGKEETLQTSYEHIGGCFLGEARHKRCVKPWKTRYLNLDPETRIMDLAAVSARSLDARLPCGMYLLAAAGSDGVLRLFLFEEAERQFTLLCQSSHHNGCVLLVHISFIQSPAGIRPFLLSAATNGKIAIRDLQPVTEWLLLYAQQQKSSTFVGASRELCEDKLSREGHGRTEEDVSEINPCMHADTSTVSSAGGPIHKGVTRHGVVDNTSAALVTSDVMDGDSRDRLNPLVHTATSTVLSSGGSMHKRVTQHTATGSEKEISSDDDDAGDDGQRKHRSGARVLNKDVHHLSGQLQMLLQKLIGREEVEGSAWEEDSDLPQQEMRDVPDWAPDQEIKTHQSGVNSLHMKSFGAGHVLLASGGDDNALTVCRLTLLSSHGADKQGKSSDPLPVLEVDSVTTKSDAHAAQITGVWILSRRHVLTASVDQRISVWCLAPETHGYQLTLASCQVVDMSDISSLDVWTEENTVYIGLSGEGIALLTLDASHFTDLV